MTERADQVIVFGDEVIVDWLRDRFGVDPDRVLMAAGFTITCERGDAMYLHLRLFVGADDLAAFPRPEAGDP